MAGSYYPSLIAYSTSCQRTLLASGRPNERPPHGSTAGPAHERTRSDMEDSATPTPGRRSHSMTRRNPLIRSAPWHPPARSRSFPPGRIFPRPARAVLALPAALRAGGAPAHAAGRLARVVVVERAPASPAAERAVRRHGGAVGRRLPLAGGFVARVPVRALPALRRSRAVAGVWSDGRVTMRSGTDCLPGDSLCYDALPPEAAWQQAIGLNRVPNKFQGDGVTVASIDTGVTPNADLGSRLLARVDLTGERDGLDRFGHGTHMAGLIAGDGSTSDEAFQGAAPEGNLISVKVAGWDGATDVSTVIAALQWVVANRERYGIRVVNLSWGTDATGSAAADPLDLAVERAWQAGLVVVVAAGNAGPAPRTVAKPADDPYVITAGAADTAGTAARGDDAVAAFSGRGPTADGVGKPDLLAPGVSLVSDRAPGSTIDRFHPGARVGTTQFKGSG